MDRWRGACAFADVLEAARAGDELAFATVWRWLHPPLLRWLGVLLPAGRDDVASEVWISVVRGLDTFRGDERAFRGWLFTIARRRAVDWARHARRQLPTTSLDDMELDMLASGDELDEDAAIAAAVARPRGLTPEQGEVLALRIIAGFSVAETAAIVGRSEGAVRVLCHRGLRPLARRTCTEMPAGVTT